MTPIPEDVHFLGLRIVTHGIDAFERNIVEVQQRLPNAVHTRASAIDGHHHSQRYLWAIHINGQLAIQGYDVAEMRQGTASKVIGCFGDLPLNRVL